MVTGMIYAALAFFCWGLFPLYFHVLKDVSPLEILSHRIVWSFAFLAALLTWRRQWTWVGRLVRQPLVIGSFMTSAVLLSTNWFVYIWAVHHGRVIDASLGYFINPLFNVMLGVLVLKERLRPMQWTAIAVAAAGVTWLTWHAGQLPWIALYLAASFGSYGLMRKIAALGALEGLAFETMLLFPLALGYLIWRALAGQNAFIAAPISIQSWLIAAGPITAVPLLWFAAGARRISLSVLGLLQYIGPTLQLLIGLWFFKEPFANDRLAGFATIWFALALYSLEGLWQTRKQTRQAARVT